MFLLIKARQGDCCSFLKETHQVSKNSNNKISIWDNKSVRKTTKEKNNQVGKSEQEAHVTHKVGDGEKVHRVVIKYRVGHRNEVYSFSRFPSRPEVLSFSQAVEWWMVPCTVTFFNALMCKSVL